MSSSTAQTEEQRQAETHQHRHLGGLKSALHNGRVGADAKEDAAEELIESGVKLSDKDKHDKTIPLKHAKAAAEEHETGHEHASRRPQA